MPSSPLAIVRFLLSCSLVAPLVLRADPSLPGKVEFNRDVRPILSENCFKCHGFDPKAREADRRLDTREGALADLEGIKAIVPKNLAESDLHVRIHSADKDDQMPPPKSGKKLTARDRAILDRWIEQGAEYQPHWAYAPIARPVVAAPAADAGFLIRNPIDALVAARHAALGLKPAAEADRRTLIRRATLDLTGLPPTPGGGGRFSAGHVARQHLRRLIARLLASPAYGERMAVYWLDLVRYADSIGFHSRQSAERFTVSRLRDPRV